jgi:hypothetical protein
MSSTFPSDMNDGTMDNNVRHTTDDEAILADTHKPINGKFE